MTIRGTIRGQLQYAINQAHAWVIRVGESRRPTTYKKAIRTMINMLVKGWNYPHGWSVDCIQMTKSKNVPQPHIRVELLYMENDESESVIYRHLYPTYFPGAWFDNGCEELRDEPERAVTD